MLLTKPLIVQLSLIVLDGHGIANFRPRVIVLGYIVLQLEFVKPGSYGVYVRCIFYDPLSLVRITAAA